MKKTLNTLALGIALSNFSPLMAKIPTAPLKIQLEKANSFKDFEQTLKLNAKGTTISQGDDGLPEKHKNWMNYAPEEGYEGMSVNKVYRTFQPTHSKKVIVAVIDSGVDIFHEEFQTRKEIRQNKRRVKEGKK